MTLPTLSFNSLLYEAAYYNVTYYFSTSKAKNSHPVKASLLPKMLQERLNCCTNDIVYVLFSNPASNYIPFPINLNEYPLFAKRILSIQLFDLLQMKGYITTLSFVNGIMVYLKSSHSNEKEYTLYNTFELRIVPSEKPKGGFTLLVSYNGKTAFSTQPLAQLLKRGIQMETIHWVLINNRILSFTEVQQSEMVNWNQCRVKINNHIYKALQISKPINERGKRFENYIKMINFLRKELLSTPKFKSIFPHNDKWISVNVTDSNVCFTINTSSSLLFGNNKRDEQPLNGLKLYGPAKRIPHGNFEILYIHPENHADLVEMFEAKLSGNTDYGLTHLMRFHYTYNPKANIAYSSNEMLLSEVTNQLDSRILNPSCTYFAILLSDLNRNSEEGRNNSLYYGLKELLLNRGIVTQFVNINNLLNSNFKYHLPNIAVALAAKLGAVPWTSNSTESSEFVIGIGAYRTSNRAEYIGNACSYTMQGQFTGFRAFDASNIYLLAANIQDAVKNYVAIHKKPKRLVIHFYKTMSDRELSPIEEKLKEIHVGIPIVIVSINKTESSDYLVFDENQGQLLKNNTIAVRFKKESWLLCNNYNPNNSKVSNSEKFPLKIHFYCSDSDFITPKVVVNEYIPQIIDFSKMYWRSIARQNRPVTLLYSEMVASYFHFFKHPLFDSKFESMPWFL